MRRYGRTIGSGRHMVQFAFLTSDGKISGYTQEAEMSLNGIRLLLAVHDPMKATTYIQAVERMARGDRLEFPKAIKEENGVYTGSVVRVTKV